MQVNVADLWRDVDYLKSVDFNELMKTVEHQDALADVQMDYVATTNKNVETAEDLEAQEEHSIFRNLLDLVGQLCSR